MIPSATKPTGPQRLTNLYTLHDRWLRAIGISFLSLLSLLSDDVFEQPLTSPAIAQILLGIASVALIWHLNRAIIVYFRDTMPPPETKALRRLGTTLVVCLVANTLFSLGFDLFRHWILHKTLADFRENGESFQLSFGSTVFRMNALSLDVFHAFFITLFYLLVYEMVFYRQDVSLYRKRLEQSEQEREKLRVANLQSQLDVLKQQVNPHFLFNSLNTLSSLISEDPEQAELFVDKLSGVYRYVLRTNEQHLTSLESELQFIDAYYHLLQTRYGRGLLLTVAVPEAYQTRQLPPLTLQLLVENAVKHNIVSARQPLSIQIGIGEDGRLLVQNTLQQKATRVISNGVGLSNIVAKYQVLNLPQPSIEISQEQFTVRLPLLTNTETERG